MKLIDFNATWCGPCQTMKPIMEEIAKSKIVPVEFVDVDEADPAFLDRFRVTDIPKLVLYDEEYDQVYWSNSGTIEKDELLYEIIKFL